MFAQALISNVLVGLDTSLEIARQEYVHDAILAGKISLLGVMTEELGQYTTIGARSSTSYQSVPLSDYTGKSGKTLPSEALERLDRLLKPFFRAYDLDGTNTLSLSELTHVFRDLGERLSEKELAEVFADMDTDKSGEIDYKEFVNGTAHYILRQDLVQAHRMVRSKSMRTKSIDIEAAEHLKAIANTSTELEEEDDEEEEVPEDIKDLPPEEQQRRIKMRSLWMMAIGTAIVLVISDPMVEVLGEIGNRTGIPAFYISFVLAPLASNASELIAAYNYAQKKTVKTISISLATLQVHYLTHCCRRFTSYE